MSDDVDIPRDQLVVITGLSGSGKSTLAKILYGDGNLDTITFKGQIFGTPEYIPPEQIVGDEVDQRADIYALGVLAFEMVTGRTPSELETEFHIKGNFLLDLGMLHCHGKLNREPSDRAP